MGDWIILHTDCLTETWKESDNLLKEQTAIMSIKGAV